MLHVTDNQIHVLTAKGANSLSQMNQNNKIFISSVDVHLREKRWKTLDDVNKEGRR